VPTCSDNKHQLYPVLLQVAVSKKTNQLWRLMYNEYERDAAKLKVCFTLAIEYLAVPAKLN